MSGNLLAGIEAGGTKILCAVAAEEGTILARERIATASPDESLKAIANFYDRQKDRYGSIKAGGLAAFGPLDLDRNSRRYGSLMATPKPGWSHLDLRNRISAILDAPTAIDTDVNCAALAELEHGAGRGLSRFCYVTIGTGIGVGCIEDGRLRTGIGHPEAGHIRVSRPRGDERFLGICPYHGDCLEGLACGPAIAARWGVGAERLEADHVAWEYEAHYIACLCINLMYTLRPQRILLGGGVMAREGLHRRIRERFIELAGNYALDRWSSDPAFIQVPALDDPSPGLVGAIALAHGLVRGEVANP